MVSVEDRVAKSHDVIYKINNDKAYIILPNSRSILRLNTTGSRIWQLLDGKRTLREVILRIREEFVIDENTAKHDTLQFADELILRGFAVRIEVCLD